MTSASGYIDLASDSDHDEIQIVTIPTTNDEIQIVTLCDREARKEDLYKIAYSIFTGRKYDSPSLSDTRDWLAVFVTESPRSGLLSEWFEAA